VIAFDQEMLLELHMNVHPSVLSSMKTGADVILMITDVSHLSLRHVFSPVVCKLIQLMTECRV